jgi:N-methylhydantoinase A/oxoprolinase/acetone carboxylase beta subunit
MVEIGIDIGGTFTDVVCVVNRSEIHSEKVQNSADLLGSVAEGIARVTRKAGIKGHEPIAYRHGTTIATNAILEGRGALTACLTTAGFEDIIEIGRQKRSRMYDIHLPAETPSFVSPRRMRRGIRERIDGDGQVLVPLDEADVIATVRHLLQRFDIQAIAVCYLNSYLNHAHERRTKELVAQHFPSLTVSLSCEVNPVFREYERTCITAFDAYVRPAVTQYVERLGGALNGSDGRLQIMQSRGAIGSMRMAVERPVNLLLSGPAAGVVGAKFVGECAGARNLITMDIGGTTCDVSLIRDGSIELTHEGRLRGFPLRVPTTDITSVGSGGGSIAWLDAAGGLHVGPRSAGASPGPACYALGGEHPTVTDASVVLGYLNPGYFAGGTMQLDAGLARAAIARLAARLDLSVDATAQGIHRILNAQMAEAIRLVTLNRGYDPRSFALIAFGGAGPVHAGAIAKLLGIREAIIPQSPGTLAALGLLAADFEFDGVRAFATAAADVEPETLEAAFAQLERHERERMRAEGVPAEGIGLRRSADMRYAGQSFELDIPFAGIATAAALAHAVEAFHRRHAEVFGHANTSRRVEFVNLRVVHYRTAPRMQVGTFCQNRTGADDGAAWRDICFEGVGRIDARIHRRDALPPGETIAGPCIIEQADTTTVVHPGQSVRADTCGNLILQAF